MSTMHPLQNLEGKKLNVYTLHLRNVTQLPLSGWKDFALHLQNTQNQLSTHPVIGGIFSVGGRDGVKPWMDVVYSERVTFSVGENCEGSISLRSENLDRKLFRYLGELIPPGGHLMVSYEGEEKIHRDTLRSLHIGIPPAVTPLGILIFLAGFQYIKDWYLSEGGFEGPRKLWGEKAHNETTVQDFYQKTLQQVNTFLKREPRSTPREIEVAAQKRAQEVLRIIRLQG